MDASKDLLLIFTRNPELGKCKTRLAKTVGDQAALDIYTFLLEHTLQITKGLPATKYVYYSEEIWQDDIWEAGIYTKKLQQGNDLGNRMHNAFVEGFDEGFEKIVVIGSDMYDLSQVDLEQAFRELDTNDFVIGPAHDGGYYLLGMKRLYAPLFKNKAWGAENVLQDTLADLKNEEIVLLDMRNDVDLYDDIKDIEAFQAFLKHMEE
ncbi:TIGR04282 family arsenosugar biosynthesis glycosyltransferase [Flagellimonas lutaonensis]|uniref:Glycosyltransferase n=1 Tax=Flagellimonas lutaonensis TaxID=516051 RepID=A0A0D5YS06_9FLAO|nr:TIGR04282 family arsenosugar biosynthesis glycosyltransferase [Allomuricauda lutaonensis]AKA34646.1 glycosyltransferase [Allomuricauda lutaonensis]